MLTEKIIGREEEINRLKACRNSKEPELVIVYGRRRVGKTFLIRRSFNYRFEFSFVGAYNKSTKVQLENFAMALQEQSGLERPIPKTWAEAFRQLREHLQQNAKNQKSVVFFDEMPWMDTGRSDFLSAFEYFWNSWGSSQNQLMFIVCGSATTWITNKLLHNKGGLYNRATQRIYLHPFTLHETEQYLKSRKIRWNRYDITECYMSMGGIPFYLKQLDPTLTYTQNIDRLFFSPRAILRDEFQNLYRSLFKNAETYEQIVMALGTKRMGLTRSEISKITGIAQNGKLGTMLNNLSQCDFIRPYNYWGKKKRGTLYQLSDYYTLFYQYFLKDKHGVDEHFWTKSIDYPSRRAWAGYAFEQVCKDHLPQIKHRLGISSVLNECSSWYGKNEEDGHAQIDLVIDRRDRVINICEIKFSQNPFIIDKDYDKQLRNKMATFQYATKTRKALHLTMITTYGVKQNMYSNIVQSQASMDNLFE